MTGSKKYPLKQEHEKVMSGEPVIHNISFKHQKLSFQHLLQLLEADDEDALKEAKIKNKTRPAEKGDRKREEKRAKMARVRAKKERI